MNTLEDTLAVLKQFEHTPMGAQLVALFRTEEKVAVPDEPQTYAIAAQTCLASGVTAAGVLSVEPTGVLRIAQAQAVQDPNVKSRPPQPVLGIFYFLLHNAVAFAITRPIKVEKTPVIHMG